MKKFEFKNNILELDIAGEIFKIDAAATSTKLKHVAKKFDEVAKAFADKDNLDDNTVKIACETTCHCVDEILGEGAMNRILKSKDKVTFYDCMDVYMFVVEEIRHFNAQKGNQYKLNREQRRKK